MGTAPEKQVPSAVCVSTCIALHFNMNLHKDFTWTTTAGDIMLERTSMSLCVPHTVQPYNMF